MDYNNTKKQPLYLQIYTSILQQIQQGGYEVGTQLPTEKEIAQQYNVSRITSKKALDMLEMDGIISRTPGRGSFVLRVPPAFEGQAGNSSGGSRLVGLVIEKLQSSFGVELLMGIEKRCTELGYTLVLKCTYGSKEAEEQYVRELYEHGVEGILILCVFDEIYNAQVLNLAYDNFPVVLIDRRLQGIPLPYVGTDNEDAARALTDQLFADGDQHIGFITADTAFSTSTIILRYNGFVESCTKHGQVVEDYQRFAGLLNHRTPEEWEEHFSINVDRCMRYMKQHDDLTAFIVTSYDYAVIVEEAAYRMKKETGKSYSLATFDSPEAVPQYKRITHIQQDQWSIGRIATDLLFKKKDGKEIPAVTHVPYRLIR
ncbi:MAG: GntR family transcriptional regulator [Oscillospiraceae bacterium]